MAKFAEAKRIARAGQPSQAQTIEDKILKNHINTNAAAEILASRGRQAQTNENYPLAVDLFEKLLFYHPEHPRATQARHPYAQVLLKLERLSDAVAMLQALFAKSETNEEIRSLGKDYFAALKKAKKHLDALLLGVELLSLNERNPTAHQHLEEQIKDLAFHLLREPDLETVWNKYRKTKSLANIVPGVGLKLAKIYYHTDRHDAAQKLLQRLVSEFPDHPLASNGASSFLKHLHNISKVSPATVGVLLPLSGKFKPFGAFAKTAIELAFGGSTKIKLVFVDTKGNSTAAADGVEKLVIEDHVIGIIGPLISRAAEAAAFRAQGLQVPLLTLSYKSSLPDIGNNIFRTALTIEAQARSLAAAAFDKLGARRFALLYPQTSYGKAFTKAFWDEVETRHGEIRGVETYEHNQTTFREPVQKLVGRWYRSSRTDYNDAIEKLRAKNLPSHRFNSMVEKIEKYLPPIVDFDAIIIPDSARRLGLIAPALAFEDIILTKNEKELNKIRKSTGNQDLKPVTLLGASTWNDPALRQHCPKYCNNAVFVDAYFRESSHTLVRDFEMNFNKHTGNRPRLIDAIAYDTGLAIRKLIQEATPLTRKELRSKLAQLKWSGLTGDLSFDPNGDILRSPLKMLTFKDGVIQKHPEAKRPLSPISVEP
ncbi:MAG: penicillin-binding protein activator [Myxococcota bacterium]|nr:penicillin-binding protein activator [Myxococcota bacterium]